MKQLAGLLTLLALAATAPAATAVVPDMMFTGNADQIADTEARVVGYAHRVADSCWFDYGPTVAYNQRKEVVCSGTTYGYLTSLTPGTVYHYRFGGQQGGEAGCGVDKTFMTDGTASPAPPTASPTACSVGPQGGGNNPPLGGRPITPDAEVAVTAHQTLSSVLRRGLRLRLTLSGSCPCKLRAELLLARKTAKKLGLGTSSAYRVVGANTRSAATGFLKQTIRMKSSVKKKLRHVRRLKLTMRATVSDPSGDRKVITRSLTLKRG